MKVFEDALHYSLMSHSKQAAVQPINHIRKKTPKQGEDHRLASAFLEKH